MENRDLEGKLKEIEVIAQPKKTNLIGKATNYLYSKYDQVYQKYPLVTNYLSSALGTVGGDVIAKQFTESPEVSSRDLAFTAAAAVPYSYLAPKMIEWSTKATDKLSNKFKLLKKNKTAHTLFNTTLLTAMYFPVNMAYWNYLTMKNQGEITLESNLAGATTLAIATIPYLAADFFAIKKLSKPETVKYLRPFYSAVEIVWNSLFCAGNYLTKRK